MPVSGSPETPIPTTSSDPVSHSAPERLEYEPRAVPADDVARQRRWERVAWGVAVAALAILALRTGGSTAPRDEDLAFVSTLVEIKQRLKHDYVRELDDKMLQQAAVDGMLALATDPYTQYIPPIDTAEFENQIAGRFDGIGVEIEPANRDKPGFTLESPSGGLVIVRPIPDSPAIRAGLLAGDLIAEVDGTDVRPLPSNQVIELIKGPTGTTVELGIERPVADGETQRLNFTVERAAVQSPILEGFGRKPDGSPIFLVPPPAELQGFGTGELPRVAYLRLTQFTQGSADAVAGVLSRLRAQEGLDGVILDLRYNPGGYLPEAVKLVDLFLDGGIITWSEGANAPRQELWAKPAAPFGDVPLVVMLNGNSASASEVTAGALADHGRATIVGERSYGKGSVQSILELDGDGRLKMTTAYYHLPSGRVVQREPEDVTWGIEPDVAAPIDPQNPDAVGPREGPPFPDQVWRAYEVLIADLAADLAADTADAAGGFDPVPPAEPTTRPSTRPTTQPITRTAA